MNMSLPNPKDKSDEKLLSDVAKFGWHVVGISAEDDLPAFAFSVGLFHNYKHPEILTMGLPIETMHQMINVIGAGVGSGTIFREDSRYADIIADFDCAFIKVSERHYQEHLGYAQWFYQGSDFPVLQCVWPDKQGKFPWDPDFPEALRSLQPLLNDETN
jgi:hypothetical protein